MRLVRCLRDQCLYRFLLRIDYSLYIFQDLCTLTEDIKKHEMEKANLLEQLACRDLKDRTSILVRTDTTI